MNYGQIRQYDIANGSGVRSVIFVTGCNFNCPGCFNIEYQNFNAGQKWTEKETKQIISYLKDPAVEGLTILGGEPMLHAKELYNIVKEIKKEVKKTIWIYSGFTIEQIIKNPERLNLLAECDVLVDGLFIEELKDLKLKFRGSSNQRIINIKEWLEREE